MALDNIQLMKNTLKEVEEKTRHLDALQKELNTTVAQFDENLHQEQIDKVLQRYLLQYYLLRNSLDIIRETVLFAPVRINPALILSLIHI